MAKQTEHRGLPGSGWVSGLLAFSDRALTLESPFPSNPYPSFWRVSVCAAIGISILLGIVLLEGWYGKEKSRYTAVQIFWVLP